METAWAIAWTCGGCRRHRKPCILSFTVRERRIDAIGYFLASCWNDGWQDARRVGYRAIKVRVIGSVPR